MATDSVEQPGQAIQPARQETPNTVHGRLLEAVHISGYTFERACGELEWLLEEDRWKYVGGGFADINSFLSTIDFSEFRIALDQRKKLSKRLASIEASQRATARVLGVDETTVRRDLDKRKDTPAAANAAEAALKVAKYSDIQPIVGDYAAHAAPADEPTCDPAWFNTEADPTKEAKRVARNQERQTNRVQTRDERRTPSSPTGKYSLLYADPPWRYEHIETESRAIENQYPTMSLDEICDLDVPAADDCVLFLWATSPKLAEAMRVIESWGFTYRTCAVWDKEVIGMGYYFRQQHELLLVAAKGSLPVPDPPSRVSSVIRSKRTKHSSKPKQVYALLEQMYPSFGESDRVELFARAERPGWAMWGNEPAVTS